MIRLHDVTKVYKTEGHRRVVLDRVSVSFNRGTSYGILGVNGAGKSTMMRLLGGTEEPSRGRVQREGRVSWPLGFSGGFHKEMTGKDNIVFVSRIYGEDPKRILSFVEDFSELGDYINVPVKTYSSGMNARFAFGVSMAMQFDTYLIDEVTSVGDARFQARCEAIFSQRRATADVVMVSHNMETILNWCNECIVLANGRAMLYTNVSQAIEVYKRLNQ